MDFSVEKIASLAYLKLSEEEKKTFEKQFQDILKYVDQLKEVPMTEREAQEMNAFHIQKAFYEQFGLDPLFSLRDETQDEDFSGLKLTNDEALKNAPKVSGLPEQLLYEVPSIIER